MAAMLVTAFALFYTAKANPSAFIYGAASATATTTVTYIPKGTATTTLLCDVQSVPGTNACGTSSPLVPDTAALLVRFTASSTNSQLAIKIERSVDNVDWYEDNLAPVATTSSSASFSIQAPNTYQWAFASSSTTGGIGGDVNIASTSVTKIIQVPIVSRYTRAVFTMTGANGAIWSQWIPKRQNP